MLKLWKTHFSVEAQRKNAARIFIFYVGGRVDFCYKNLENFFRVIKTYLKIASFLMKAYFSTLKTISYQHENVEKKK
jgi:hypothetical protein